MHTNNTTREASRGFTSKATKLAYREDSGENIPIFCPSFFDVQLVRMHPIAEITLSEPSAGRTACAVSPAHAYIFRGGSFCQKIRAVVGNVSQGQLQTEGVGVGGEK